MPATRNSVAIFLDLFASHRDIHSVRFLNYTKHAGAVFFGNYTTRMFGDPDSESVWQMLPWV